MPFERGNAACVHGSQGNYCSTQYQGSVILLLLLSKARLIIEPVVSFSGMTDGCAALKRNCETGGKLSVNIN